MRYFANFGVAGTVYLARYIHIYYVQRDLVPMHRGRYSIKNLTAYTQGNSCT